MPLPPHDSDAVAAAFAVHAAHVALAEGADMDEAFDSAVTVAYNDPTAASVFTSVDPDSVHAVDGLHSLDEALVAALAWAREGSGADGEAAAFAVLPRSAHARVTRRARLEDVTFEPEMSAAQPWTPLSDDMTAAAVAADAGPADGEVLERVTIVRRARYKPVAENVEGANAAGFAALDGNTILTKGHKTKTLAKQAAIALLKEKGLDDHSLPVLDVVKIAGKENGQPLLRVRRTRQKQTLAVKLTYATRKPAAKEPKVAGWVFVTR